MAVSGCVFPARIPHHLTGERRRDVERPVVRSARFAEPVVADGAPGPVVQNFETALVGGIRSIHEPNIPLMVLTGGAGSTPAGSRPDAVPIRIRGADLNLVLGPGGEPGERRPRDRHGLGAVLPDLCVDDAVAHVVAVNFRRIGIRVMRLAPLNLELGRASRLHRRCVQPGFPGRRRSIERRDDVRPRAA